MPFTANVRFPDGEAVSIEEEYITLVEVLEENGLLRRWFESLAMMPENLLDSELSKMMVNMKANGEKEELVQLVGLLRNRNVYDAIVKALSG